MASGEWDVYDIENPKKKKERKIMSLLQKVEALFTLDRKKEQL